MPTGSVTVWVTARDLGGNEAKSSEVELFVVSQEEASGGGAAAPGASLLAALRLRRVLGRLTRPTGASDSA